MAYKGSFKPNNPQKYKGNPTNITYRSRWELILMQKFDAHPDVLEWSSEEIIIPYISPIDNRMHRYFPDFYIKRKGIDGKIDCMLIEVKPFNQTKPPTILKKPTRRYITEVQQYGINTSKWKYAEAYCADRGWKFVIITEKDLDLKF